MIYFIQDGEEGLIKIGYSDDVLDRIRTLSTSTHKRLRILLVVGGGIEQETQLHEHFSFAHKRGEWFWPVKELLEFIEGYKLSFTEPPTVMLRRLIRHEQLDESKICELRDRGESLRNICLEIFGKKPSGRQEGRVREILRKSGRSLSVRRPLDEQKICQLHAEGMSLRGICWAVLGTGAGGNQVERIKEVLRENGRI